MSIDSGTIVVVKITARGIRSIRCRIREPFCCEPWSELFRTVVRAFSRDLGNADFTTSTVTK